MSGPATSNALILHSTRFGDVEVDTASVIDFPTGLIGLGGSRYALLSTKPGSPFIWLHSLDDPAIALPIVNPHRFFSDFALELDDDTAAELGLDASVEVHVYVTVRAAPRLEDFAANLRAPIIIFGGHGHQVINQAPGNTLRAPLFPAGAPQGADEPQPAKA